MTTNATTIVDMRILPFTEQICTNREFRIGDPKGLTVGCPIKLQEKWLGERLVNADGTTLLIQDITGSRYGFDEIKYEDWGTSYVFGLPGERIITAKVYRDGVVVLTGNSPARQLSVDYHLIVETRILKVHDFISFPFDMSTPKNAPENVKNSRCSLITQEINFGDHAEDIDFRYTPIVTKTPLDTIRENADLYVPYKELYTHGCFGPTMVFLGSTTAYTVWVDVNITSSPKVFVTARLSPCNAPHGYLTFVRKQSDAKK